MYKTCTQCGIDKDCEEFSLNNRQSDGRKPYCKDCANKAARDYWHRTKDDRKASTALWHKNNPERMMDHRRAWRDRNPEYIRNASSVRRSKLKMSKASSDKTLAYRKFIKNDPCYYCGSKTEKMHDDHYYPVARGGTNHWFNIVRACSKCNYAKSKTRGSVFERNVAA